MAAVKKSRYRDTERDRFNVLSPKAAKALLKSMEGKQAAMRSCWYCNGAHVHLKSANYPINCLWGCGQWYLTGFPAPIVVLRAKGVEITDETMKKFEDALGEVL